MCATEYKMTGLGKLVANISPDRSSLTPHVLTGYFPFYPFSPRPNFEENIINYLYKIFGYSIYNIFILQSKIVSETMGVNPETRPNANSTCRTFAHKELYPQQSLQGRISAHNINFAYYKDILLFNYN